MRVVATAFSVLMVSLTLNCGDSGTKETSGTPSELEGTWAGAPVDDPDDVMTMVFNGNSFSWSILGQEMFRGIMTLDSAVTPHQLDFNISWCPPGCPYVGKTGIGIYKLYPSGDSVLVAGCEPGITTRPTSFDPLEGYDVIMMVKQQQ